jgi:hypothetical protein
MRTKYQEGEEATVSQGESESEAGESESEARNDQSCILFSGER